MSRTYGWTRHGSDPLVHIVTDVAERPVHNGTPRREVFWACRPTAHSGRVRAEVSDTIPEGLTLCSTCRLTTAVAPRGVAVVYAVKVGDEVKVGWTADLPTRASLLGGEVLAYRKGARPLETALLRRLRPIIRRGREWFGAGDVDQIVRALLTVEAAA